MSSRPDDATLSRLYRDNGMTIAAVAARFGVAPQTVQHWLVAAGIPRRQPAACQRGDIDDEELRNLYVAEGYSAAQIGARLGCSPSLVYFRLERLGVLRRARRPRSAGPPDGELGRLYVDEGLSLAALAARFGVTPRAVADGCRRRRSPPGEHVASSRPPPWRSSSVATPPAGAPLPWPAAMAARPLPSTVASTRPGAPALAAVGDWSGTW